MRSAPQRNPVHRFTVDRHLVETAVEASKYQRDVSRPDLLVVGALLHDIGKGRPHTDHTDVGVELIKDLAPHLGFDEADSAVLVDLVRYHLLLPETATRRDLEDPATVAGVVEAVGDLPMLDLLYALTKADAAATGPIAWSDWRAALIRDLVSRVRQSLSGGHVPPRLALRPAQQDMLDRRATDLLIESEGPGSLRTITVTSQDRVGLLAQVAGVLAVNRLDVRAARAVGADGMALSEWTVDRAYGGQLEPARLREDLRLALSGALDIGARLDRREESYPETSRALALEPRVEVVEGASDSATVVEVRTYDRPGALFRLASVIAECGLDVVAARADSLGSNVVDVFYLRNEAGAPLDDAESAGLIKRLLESASN